MTKKPIATVADELATAVKNAETVYGKKAMDHIKAINWDDHRQEIVILTDSLQKCCEQFPGLVYADYPIVLRKRQSTPSNR